MATFEYNALTASGRLMRGVVEAGSQEEASEMLRDMDLTVNEIAKAKEKRAKTAIGRNELLLFNQQLASITKAGIPLEKGLRELAVDAGSRSMRKLITEVADDLEAGVSIDKAIEQRQQRFPALYSRILEAGVKTGRLGEMLTSLNRHIEIGNRTRRIIFEAMCYPVVVAVLAAVVITAVFILVVPPFSEVLFDMSNGNATLPMLTQWFIQMADNVIPFWICVIIFIAAMTALWGVLSASPGGRRFKESIFLKIPLIGLIYHRGVLARMAEAMAILVAAGCDMPETLRLSAGASGSEKMKLECETLAGQIEQGEAVMEAGMSCGMIPRLFLYSVQLGSQRNELQDNLYILGTMYSEQTHCLQNRLQAVMLPTMIIGLGMFIGTMVLAMFLPMVRIITVMI
jgi:type IV pilus assembly protein PilC